MGRYSSVQAYADNNTNVRKVPYEQAAAAAVSSEGSKQTASVKPEKVVNPYGSTAGAGSGDFHVYRHARNRELHRQKVMELSAKEQTEEEAYQQELAANQQWEEERTAKRRKKRERQKNAKKRKQNLAKAGIDVSNDVADNREDEEEEEEFTYTPGSALEPIEETTKKEETKDAPTTTKESTSPIEIPKHEKLNKDTKTST